VLGVLYGSFTHPLTILSGAAVSWIRRARHAAHLQQHYDGGLRVGAQREQGKSLTEAIHEACLVRFRAIMMTTMAALVDTLPSRSTGAQGLSHAGCSVSRLSADALFSRMAKAHRRLHRRARRRASEPPATVREPDASRQAKARTSIYM
jgi:hypothetical protein